MDYEDFLLRLIEIENAGKKERRQAKLKADAHFEAERHLEDIDYSFNPNLDLYQLHFPPSYGHFPYGSRWLIIKPYHLKPAERQYLTLIHESPVRDIHTVRHRPCPLM